MKIARLDNEVFFKKAFTNPIVFRGFVKDIIGIEINLTKIETVANDYFYNYIRLRFIKIK